MIRTGTVQGSHQGSHLGNKETTAKEGIRYQGIEVFGSKGLEEEILTAKQTQTKPSQDRKGNTQEITCLYTPTRAHSYA